MWKSSFVEDANIDGPVPLRQALIFFNYGVREHKKCHTGHRTINPKTVFKSLLCHTLEYNVEFYALFLDFFSKIFYKNSVFLEK